MKKILVSLSATMLVLFTACNTNDEVIPSIKFDDADLNVTTESIVTTEAAVDDAVEAADYEVELYSGSEAALSSTTEQLANESELKSGGNSYLSQFRKRYRSEICPNVSIVSVDGGFPKTITLDYGEATELSNGRVLSGIIQIVISAPPREDGATRTITFIGFFVDDLGIDGTIVKTFLGDKITERIVQITRDLVFTWSDGLTVTHTAELTRTWIEGMDTPFDHSDDVIEITGWSNCEDSDGNVYLKEITVPLVKKGDCRFLVSGEVTLSQNGLVFAVIDYGDGTCDNIATITTEDGTVEFIIGDCVRDKIQDKIQDRIHQ